MKLIWNYICFLLLFYLVADFIPISENGIRVLSFIISLSIVLDRIENHIKKVTTHENNNKEKQR